MTNYEKLVEALRWCDASFMHECDNCLYLTYKHNKDDCMDRMLRDAAAAIEALQAQLPKRGVKKNADIIRAMTDEELAEWVTSEGRYFGEEYEGYMSCLDWLKEEVQDG
jgi:hypothetical protein